MQLQVLKKNILILFSLRSQDAITYLKNSKIVGNCKYDNKILKWK